MLRTSLLLLASILVTPPRASAATAEDERREAMTLVQASRCEAALTVLERARREDPGDARLPRLAGECLIRLQRYTEALASLSESKRLDPTMPDTDLYLGIAHYHQGDLEASEKELEAARQTSPGRAEISLYRGLILLQRAQAREAAAALESARLTDTRGVEPVASYYEGLAWLAADERERAREALRRVQEQAPGSEWADAAARALETTPGWGPRQSYEELSTGVEWNTNVTLAGTATAPDTISRRRDLSTVWSALAGTEVYRGERWSVGALASYYGSAHTKLSAFDLQYPGASLWIDRKLWDDTTLRLQSSFNYAWYGYQPYEVLGALTPQVFKTWRDHGVTWAYARFFGSDYFFDTFDLADGVGPPGVDEAKERNRDGWGVTAGVLHTLPLPDLGLDLRGGVHYHHYRSVGREWRYDGYEAVLGLRKTLPLRFALDLQASCLYEPFRHPSTYPDNDTVPLRFANVRRRDDVWQVEARLERPITSWLKASARYAYLANGSNTAVFNYHQQIWGGYLTASFRQP